MKFLDLLAALAAIYEVSAGSNRYCGTMLVKVLDNVCPIGINEVVAKRSVPLYSNFGVIDINNDADDNTADDMSASILNSILSKENTNTYTEVRRHRGLLGIYNECCVKGCSINELSSYCHNPGTKRTCGNMLVGALNTICTSGYNRLPTKRSASNQIYFRDIYNETAPHQRDSRPFLEDLLTDENTNALIRMRRRRQLLGIHDECCVKGCNFTELASYCN